MCGHTGMHMCVGSHVPHVCLGIEACPHVLHDHHAPMCTHPPRLWSRGNICLLPAQGWEPGCGKGEVPEAASDRSALGPPSGPAHSASSPFTPRSVLDFDFEKLCSISLSHINVYACLVCGKYFQGECSNATVQHHAGGPGGRGLQRVPLVLTLPPGLTVQEPAKLGSVTLLLLYNVPRALQQSATSFTQPSFACTNMCAYMIMCGDCECKYMYVWMCMYTCIYTCKCACAHAYT